MEVSGGGGFLLLLFGVVLMPRSATVLLADAARRTLTDVSSPPAPSPAADAPILPGVVVSPPTVKIPTEGDNHYQKQVLVAVILSLVAVIVMAVSATYAWSFWRKAREALDSKDMKLQNRSNGHMLLPVLGKLNSNKMSNKEVIAMMDFSVLETATDKFSEKNILGKGGLGCVYRACLDGNVVAAVKKLNCCRQEVEKEFENELDFLGKIRHPNVISVLGYCSHEDTRLVIYELMENGSLETQLHGSSHGSALSWHTRLKIALDAARGLEHLHEHCNPIIIHRDIKSSNILLDSVYNAKISDFGLATYGGNHNRDDINPSGTVGYVAAEYLLDGQLTEKSDVYSFGVVLLELLLGRKPVERVGESHCESIVSWAMPQITDRTKLPQIIDPVIQNTMDLRHLYQVAAVAVLCVQPEPSYRPLIADVLHSLVPLVPVELGGTLRVVEQPRSAG
ncbi:probable receptor-like protein kinase At1g80640 isoform X2 [Lolium perenne]|uniref:probable receptor-like protein kinase At1g80640 isoform X2 n=1 Tax=Lolium perenne TaxID=4522 RepID=UPI0021F5EFC1|nr:probable receptor-like protein kinase At1g80640 isoform X2 [Lolium perenne]